MPTSIDLTQIRSYAYRLAKYFNSIPKLLSLVAISPLCFLAFGLHENATSPTVALYQENKAAADEFYSAVSTKWPFNRALVLEKLERVTSTYVATSENQPFKLVELQRLEMWTLEAKTMAEQRLYLDAVQSYGKNIVMSEPFFSNVSMIVLVSCMLSIPSYYGVFFLFRC